MFMSLCVIITVQRQALYYEVYQRFIGYYFHEFLQFRELCFLKSLFFSLFSCKILNLKSSINSQLSHLTPSLVFPDSPLTSSTVYSLPLVTPPEVLKILNSSSLESSSLDFIPSSLLKSCPSIFANIIAHLAYLSLSLPSNYYLQP